MIRIGRLFLRLMLLCVSTLYYLYSFSQVCTTDVFTKSYDLGPPKGQFLTILPGSGTIFGGRDFYNPNQIGLVKTTPSGDIVYNKRIEVVSNSNLSAGCLNKDKNIVVGTASNLVILDTNGIVLKSALTSVPWSNLYDIKTDAQGNIYALYEATGANRDQQHILTKIAPDLSKSLWSVAFGAYYSSYYAGIMIDNDKVFAVGSLPISGADTTLGSVLCFDAANGLLLKEVSFRLDGYGCTMRTMHKTDAGYLMEGFYHPSGQNIIHNHVIVRLDDSLQPVKASRVTNLFNTDQLFIEPDNQGGFYASGMSVWTNLFHCDRQDSVTWSRVSVANRTGVGAFAVSATNLYSLDQYCWALLKTDFNGFAGGCQEGTLPMGTVPLIPTLANNTITHIAAGVSIGSVTNTVSDKTFMTREECKMISTCSSVKIIGSNSLCTNGSPAMFKGRRDIGCRLPVQWILNGSTASLNTFNDSTLSIQFQSSGHYQLIASLPSDCEVIADTLNIDVSVSSQPALNLGSDKELCSGNFMLLNASKGFVSYTWQDGSTDSIFVVTNPGLYHVTTTDACGGVYQDSVTITEAPPIPFSVGQDRSKCNNDTIHLTAPSGFINYSWSPAYNISSTTQSNVVVNPSLDTTYFAKAEKTPGCFAFDTVHIAVCYCFSFQL